MAVPPRRCSPVRGRDPRPAWSEVQASLKLECPWQLGWAKLGCRLVGSNQSWHLGLQWCQPPWEVCSCQNRCRQLHRLELRRRSDNLLARWSYSENSTETYHVDGGDSSGGLRDCDWSALAVGTSPSTSCATSTSLLPLLVLGSDMTVVETYSAAVAPITSTNALTTGTSSASSTT